MLEAGKIIRTGNKLYRVEYVNASRAYCIPLSQAKELDAEEALDPEESGPVKQRAKGINIAPTSLVETWDSEADIPPFARPGQPVAVKEKVMGIAAMPIAPRSARQDNRDRELRNAQRKSNDRAAGIGTKNGTGALSKANRKLTGAAAVAQAKAKAEGRTPKEPKTYRKCLCGCGLDTAGHFAIGHDSRFKSWMIKIERGTAVPDDLPTVVRKAYEFKKVGPGFRTTRDYRGNPHTGYDRA